MSPPPETIDNSAVSPAQDMASIDQQSEKAHIRIEVGRPDRELCLYPGHIGYDLQEELEFLSPRAIEPNIFYTARFLAPAMPRLEDRQINFAVIRDTQGRSRTRLLMPYSVEKPGFAAGPSAIRAWSNHLVPLGIPLIDGKNTAETIGNLLDGFAKPELELPSVFIFPNIRQNGAFVKMLQTIAQNRNLPFTIANSYQRPILDHNSVNRPLFVEYEQGLENHWQRLSEKGDVAYKIWQNPRDIHARFEEFLLLDEQNAKKQDRDSLLVDRHQSAFVREAVANFAKGDAIRIHTIDLDGKAIASVVVLIMNGEAYLGRCIYEDAYSEFLPTELLLAEVTKTHLDHPGINRTDSCRSADHPLIERFWQKREDMGTLIVGLLPDSQRSVEQVASNLHLYRSNRNIAKKLYDKLLNQSET